MGPTGAARWALLAVLHTIVPAWAEAQETRAAIIAEAQAIKAAQLAPYAPSKAERIAADMKERLFDTPNGFYPWFESVYSGGGFTLGSGYRRYYGDQTSWSVRGLFSAKAYKLAEVVTDAHAIGKGRMNLQAIAGWRDATQVSFYGLGSDTSIDAKTNFQLTQAYAGVSARIPAVGPFAFDLGFRVEDSSLDSGHGSSPSIEERYTEDTAPGLLADPTYLRLTMTGGIDSRPSAGYARRGGLYALTYDAFGDQDGVYSFEILQAEIIQHLPILRENWVFSIHSVAKTTVDDTSTVPFFLLPALGSGSTLRAYPSWRFRDRHSILVSGEFRWIPNASFLDLAIFYDAGKVVNRPRRSQLFATDARLAASACAFMVRSRPRCASTSRTGDEGFNLVFSGAAAF